MSKEQIEGMAYSVCRLENKPKGCAACMWKATCSEYLSAEAYYNAGYRKQSNLYPCDVCKFNPPSSGDGKPCTVCPAQAKGGAE